MPHFIKTGFWEKSQKGALGWLNLERIIADVIGGPYQQVTNTAVALTDAAEIDLSATKHTLTSSSSTREFTISYIGDDITLEVTLNAISAIYTFPVGSLCVSEGLSLGDNLLELAGNSGDKYIIGIKNIDGNYYIVSKNFGQ